MEVLADLVDQLERLLDQLVSPIDAARLRVPYVAVIGAREAAAGLVSLRLRDGRELPARPAADALVMIGAVVAARSLDLVPPRSPWS